MDHYVEQAKVIARNFTEQVAERPHDATQIAEHAMKEMGRLADLTTSYNSRDIEDVKVIIQVHLEPWNGPVTQMAWRQIVPQLNDTTSHRSIIHKCLVDALSGLLRKHSAFTEYALADAYQYNPSSAAEWSKDFLQQDGRVCGIAGR